MDKGSNLEFFTYSIGHPISRLPRSVRSAPIPCSLRSVQKTQQAEATRGVGKRGGGVALMNAYEAGRPDTRRYRERYQGILGRTWRPDWEMSDTEEK